MRSKMIKGLVSLALLGIMVLGFQNCSPVAFQNSEFDSSSFEQPVVVSPGTPKKCTFDGKEYAEGDRVIAYLASSGTTCTSEERICEDGSFTGSYAYASCQVNAPAACLFNGQTIPSGGSVQAFQQSTVEFGQNCISEQRVCNNGVLSGSFNHSSCQPGVAANCLFNGQTIPHGGSVKAYQTSAVNYGSSCVAQDRVCSNGTLSGSYSFAACSPGAPRSCLFNGQTIAHGQAVNAFLSANVPYGQSCTSQSRVCNDGSLSGSYANSACVVAAQPTPKCTAVGSSTVLPAFTRVGDKCAITSNYSITFNCDRDIVGKPYGIRISNSRTYKDGSSRYMGSSYYHQNYSTTLYKLTDSSFVLNNPRSLTITANFLFRDHGVDEPYNNVYQCNYVDRYDMRLDFYVQQNPGDLPTSFMGSGEWPSLTLPAR